jgi:hypothetical protein
MRGVPIAALEALRRQLEGFAYAYCCKRIFRDEMARLPFRELARYALSYRARQG